jgi:hypothetical protein
MLAVVYDDTGGWYDQVVSPHEGVPNDEVRKRPFLAIFTLK